VRRRLRLLLLIGLAGASAQARQSDGLRPGLIKPGGLPVFFSSQGPLAYTSLTASEIPKNAVPIGHVRGQRCQYSMSVPITASVRSGSISGAVGNGTYAKILQDMARSHPGLQGIYDVKVDLHYSSILGVFGRLCTEINAEGFR
jgi:hypothetical protein